MLIAAWECPLGFACTTPSPSRATCPRASLPMSASSSSSSTSSSGSTTESDEDSAPPPPPAAQLSVEVHDGRAAHQLPFLRSDASSGWVLNAQDLWQGPLRSTAKPVLLKNIRAAYQRAGDDELESYRLGTDADEHIWLTPEQVMRVFVCRAQIGNTDAGGRAALAASFIGPMARLLRNVSVITKEDIVRAYTEKESKLSVTNSIIDVVLQGGRVAEGSQATRSQRQYQKLRRAMLLRLLRGSGSRKTAPFEELVPGVGEPVPVPRTPGSGAAPAPRCNQGRRRADSGGGGGGIRGCRGRRGRG